MSDVNDKSGEQEAAEAERGPRAGERLRDARREKEISVLEVAKELHLDEPKVRALERNEFDALGAPVFAKGHLRKYALLVDIDPDEVLTEYYQMNREGPEPLVISPRAQPRRELSPGPWIGVIVVIILVAAAYWWFAVRKPAVQTQAPPVAEAPAVEQSPMEQSALEPPALPAEELPAGQQEQPAAEPEVEASEEAPTPAMPPDDGQVSLAVTYTGDCWTEISDAKGNRLYFNLGKSGRTVNVSGQAPLNALFGDAGNVTIEVNGVARPIAAAERRGKTARLTIAQP